MPAATPIANLPLTLTVSIDVLASHLESMIDSAIRYVSFQWIKSIDEAPNSALKFAEVDYSAIETVFRGGAIIIRLLEGTKEFAADASPSERMSRSGRYLDLPRCLAGLNALAQSVEYGHHFADIIRDNADAITGDVYLQFCLFGEVVYT